jgi:gluconolactonase
MRRARCGNASAKGGRVGEAKRELPTNVYRVASNGRVTIAVGADQLPGAPNGLAFAPD